MKAHISLFGIFIWCLAILFYAYESFLRIFLGTIAPEFMEQLKLTTQQFSLVGSAFFIVYAFMQIPVGILIEKLGTRTVLSSASLICSIGIVLLVYAQGFYSVLFSRLVTGFGSSFGFVALLVLTLNWFPRSYFGFLSGIAIFLGSLGPLLAGAPFAYLIERMGGDWRMIMLWVALFGIALTLSLALFVRTKPKQYKQRIIFLSLYEPLHQKMLLLLKNSQVWCIVLAGSFLYVSLPLLGAFWGPFYLQSKGMGKTDAAFIVSMIWIGFAIGSPALGRLSDRLKRRVPFILGGSILGVITSGIILYVPVNQIILTILFFLMGLASSSQVLTYALMVENTPTKVHSLALGLKSTVSTLFSAIFPLITGAIIQSSLATTGLINLQKRHFVEGLSIIPLAYIIAAFIIVISVKETFCRPQHELHKLQTFHKASDLL